MFIFNWDFISNLEELEDLGAAKRLLSLFTLAILCIAFADILALSCRQLGLSLKEGWLWCFSMRKAWNWRKSCVNSDAFLLLSTDMGLTSCSKFSKMKFLKFLKDGLEESISCYCIYLFIPSRYSSTKTLKKQYACFRQSFRLVSCSVICIDWNNAFLHIFSDVAWTALRRNCTPNQNCAYFVHYLRIINTLKKYIIGILKQIVWEIKTGIQIVGGQAVLELLIKTIFCLFLIAIAIFEFLRKFASR